MHYANGDHYIGEFRDDKREGTGKFYYVQLKEVYQVFFLFFFFEFFLVFYFFKGEWSENKRQGKGALIKEDGAVIEGYFNNDLPPPSFF
jgi:hypothetical protein